MIRVLLAAPLPPPEGGIAKWTTLILGVDTPPDIERHHFDTAVHIQYHFTSPLTPRRIWKQLWLTLRFLLTCSRLRPDVLHLTSSYDSGWRRDALLLGWASRLGAAAIVNLRGGDFERFYRGVSPRRQARIRRTLARCAAVVPITAETAAFLRALGLTNVTVIPNCIVLGAKPERPPSTTDTGWTRWLFVGWVMPAKGLVELLDALRAIPNATLTLVGPAVRQANGDSAAIVRTALDDPMLAGRITHVPGLPIQEVARLYPAHDIFVFPTHREGFPNVLLEAMEAGLPIVATRVGAIPEMVRHEREALLVPARDTAALVGAIQRLQRDPSLADMLARAARQRVETEYGLDAISDAWLTLYRRVAPQALPAR